MSVSSFSCPRCGATLDADTPDTPTLKCRFCGTVVHNPLYREDKAPDRIAMPVININLPQSVVAAPPAPPPGFYREERQLPAVSPKNWTVTLLLCLFLGVFGGHRFYTGHFWIGLAQLLTFGMAGIWTAIDLILIVTGIYRDKNGLPLSGRRLARRIGVGGAALLLFACIVGCIVVALAGDSITKIDPPADHGWITGVERCVGSSSYGELVLPDRINLWEGWGADRGSVVGTVTHDTYVTVLEARRDTSSKVTYYKVQTESGLKGWISQDFVQFQPISEGVVPREDC